jgi:hypothetical protein
MQAPVDNGNMNARFCPAAAQGELPRLEIIIKLFPKAFNIIEQTNHNKFTGIFFIMTSNFQDTFCLL